MMRILIWTFSQNYRRNHSLINAGEKWHYYISAFIARRLYFLYIPLRNHLHKKKYLISINNISNAVGHLYPEVDYICRMKKVGLISPEYTVICIWPKNPINKGFIQAIKNKNINKEVIFILSGFLDLLIFPMLLRFPELTINASQSSLNHSIDWNDKKKSYGKQLSYSEVFRIRQAEYFKLRRKTKNYYPLKNNLKLDDDLKFFLGFDKYYVVQIKDKAVNATAKPLNPETYLPTIEKIIQDGYGVVFAGREKIPECFKILGVVNYSESHFANSYNDYCLVINSEGVIASASGFCYIPDLLGIPLLSLNNWCLLGYAGSRTIQIPTVINLKDHTPIKFKDQLKLAYQIGQINDENNTLRQNYEIIDATEVDIIEGYKELKINFLNGEIVDIEKVQIRFNELFPNESIFYQMSRISKSFLQNNIERF